MSYNQELGFEDQFGKLIADNTQNLADISTQHKFSAERWRYFRRDATSGPLSREFVQYGETNGFTDNVDTFRIAPGGQDLAAELDTAERFRYAVGYTQEVSFTFQTNQPLGTGDRVVVGAGDPDIANNSAAADGWFLEFNSNLADNEAYFNIYRNGTIISNGGANNLVTFEKNIDDWRRFEIEFNWYGVGSAKLTETYVDANGNQINSEIDEIGVPAGKSAESANKNVAYAIRSGGNGTTLETGSVGVVINGDIDRIVREKSDRFEETLATADTWVPAFAIRGERGVRRPTNIELRDLSVIRWTAAEDEVEVIVKGFDETKVTFGGGDAWDTPDPLTSANTYLESRTDVTQIADQTGTLVANTTTPGGYEIFRTELSPTGQQFKEGTTAAPGIRAPRKIYDSDVAVVLLKSPVTGETATLNYGVTEGF